MAEKLGIEFEAAAKQVAKDIQETAKAAQKAEKAMDDMKSPLSNKKTAEQNRQIDQTIDKWSKASHQHKQGGQPAGKPPVTGNPSQGGKGGWFDRNAMPSAGQWGGAVGAAATGSFGSLIQTAAQAVGTMIGGPIGGFVGALAGAVVGKVADKISESIGTAEKNLIATSYLNRSIGGNPGNFNALYGHARGISNRVGGLLNAETIQLMNTVARASGTSSMDQLARDSELSARWGKALGVDVNQTGRFFGQMRGIGLATNEMQLRQMGTVIGEAIGRSRTFAKADEMLGAVSNFALMTTRITLSGSRKTVENYTGVLSEMARGNNKDIGGFASMLGQADSGYRSGGRMGLASWTLRMMGYQAGYSPLINALDVRAMNEKGMFGSGASIFQKGSKEYTFMTDSEKRRADAIRADMRRRGINPDRSNIEIEIDSLERRMGRGMQMGYSLANDLGITYSQAIDLYNAVRNYGGAAGIGHQLENRYGLTELDEAQTMKAAMFMDADKAGLVKGARELLAGHGYKDKLSDSERESLERAVKSSNEQELRKAVVMTAARKKWVKDHGEIIESTIKGTENNLERIGSHLVGIKSMVTELKGHFVDAALSPDTSDFYIGDYSSAGESSDGDANVKALFLKESGTRYKLGVNDCASYIRDLIIGDSTIPSKVKDKVRGQSSEGLVTTVAAMTGGMITGDRLSPGNIKSGTLLGIDTGDRGFDRGRKYGIDHIMYVYRDPATGELMVTQNAAFDYGAGKNGNKGVQTMRYADYMRRYGKNIKAMYGAFIGGTRAVNRPSTQDTPNPLTSVASPEVLDKVGESIEAGTDEGSAFNIDLSGIIEDINGNEIGQFENQRIAS